ncbi:hypothetical protein [Bacteroides acidifaciens]|uniref:hypothetical protein n=1 Tax=Bacteroides acidifaciens TaxID=85831 RepID=UPI003F693B5C
MISNGNLIKLGKWYCSELNYNRYNRFVPPLSSAGLAMENIGQGLDENGIR